LVTGKELPMGTGFDNFSDTAHHGFAYLPPAVLRNRLLLKGLMEENGFKALDTEWWHYSLPDARNYELLDIDFAVLDAMGRKRRR
jgi:zinc D-Ala-D-Ala dipeptidase